MNAYQNRDIIVEFNRVVRKLKETGADLSKIKIRIADGGKPSYITKRILEEMGYQHD